jgi:hypothetical protein
MRRAVTADYVQAADVRAPESLGAVVLYTKELKMPTSGFVRFSLTVLITVGVATPGTSVQAQERGGTAQTDKVQAVNSGANPYRVIRNWAQDPEGRPWGGSNGVAIDLDGKSVWATDRCSPGTIPGCLGTKANPVHKFDESGK